MTERVLATVLVVEDDERTLNAYRRAHSERFIIIPAFSMADARAVLRQRTVDFIIVDLRLPDGSGLELLKEIAGEQPRALRAVLSGAIDLATAASAGRVADVIAKKPTPLKRVIAALESPPAEFPILLGDADAGDDDSRPAPLEELIDRAMARAYSRNHRNVSKTAEELGIGRPTVYRALRRMGLLDPD
jgi:two-component system response regulator RegA